VQGFSVTGGDASAENPAGGALEVRARLAPERPARVATAVFLPPEVPDPPDAPFAKNSGLGWNYTLLASPALHPGQTVRATVTADAANTAAVRVRLGLRHYTAGDELRDAHGEAERLEPGRTATLAWRVPDLGGLPVFDVGLEVLADEAQEAVVRLERLGWDGAPDLTLGRPAEPGAGAMWRRAWVNAAERQDRNAPEPFRVLHGHGAGLILYGARDWTDYAVEAEVTLRAALGGGLCARAQGQRRHYALRLERGSTARLVKTLNGETVLGEAPFAWLDGRAYRLRLEARGPHLRALVDGEPLFEATDDADPLLGGGVALIVEEGWLSSGPVRVSPLG
jgi:hypothetical protein